MAESNRTQGTENEEWNKTNPSNGSNQNPVDQALRKEKQPTSSEDLAPIHNTHEIGTSGGDQRAPDKQPPVPPAEDDQPGQPVPPVPVEEPGDGAAPEPEFEEPGKEVPQRTDG